MTSLGFPKNKKKTAQSSETNGISQPIFEN